MRTRSRLKTIPNLVQSMSEAVRLIQPAQKDDTEMPPEKIFSDVEKATVTLLKKASGLGEK